MNTGIDIVHIPRINNIKDGRIFDDYERDYCEHHHCPDTHYAGIYAAKEAVKKASKCSLSIFDIHIRHHNNGAPYIIDCEYNVDISISHDGEYAIAIAIIY